MKRTPQARSSEQTTSPSPIIKTIFQEKMRYACNCLKHQNNQKNIMTILRWVNARIMSNMEERLLHGRNKGTGKYTVSGIHCHMIVTFKQKISN